MLCRLALTKAVPPVDGTPKKGAQVPRFPGADILAHWEKAWDDLHELQALCQRILERGNLAPEPKGILAEFKTNVDGHIAEIWRVCEQYQQQYFETTHKLRGIMAEFTHIKGTAKVDLATAGLDRKLLMGLQKVWDKIL